MSPNTHPHPIQFRVAAYNVQVGRCATPEEIGRALAPFDLDIVCFSEAPAGDWTQRAGAILDMPHTVQGKYPTAGHDDKFKTIASKMPLFDTEEILMADTLHTVTKAKTEIQNQTIAIYSVHFPFGWRDQAHIDETTGKITAFVDYLREQPAEEIAVIMGDFNFEPSNTKIKNIYHEMFINIGLDISWRDLNIDISKHCTCRLDAPDEERLGHVIDHIMYDPQKIKAVDGDIITLSPPLSDHQPIWAHLQLQ